mgnify:CR=1 FL=1
MDVEELKKRARAWAEYDPDPVTRAEIEALLVSPEIERTDLMDRFSSALEFGTAGLRGVIGAGPNRMNRAVVLRTTWGLAEYLKEAVPSDTTRGVAIGFDGRRMSREFAEDVACVLAAEGIRSFLFSEVVPTPLLAFAVLHLQCAAGVMITASHNPPEYNGYKAYWGNGAQIIPPIDVGIARAINRAPAAKDVPRMVLEAAVEKGLVRTLDDEVETAYLNGVKSLGVRKDGHRALSIVYTALHGVGDKLCCRAFLDAGFSSVTSVPEQRQPDAAAPARQADLRWRPTRVRGRSPGFTLGRPPASHASAPHAGPSPAIPESERDTCVMPSRALGRHLPDRRPCSGAEEEWSVAADVPTVQRPEFCA